MGTLFHRNHSADVFAKHSSECFSGVQYGRKRGYQIGRAGCHAVHGNWNGRHLFVMQAGVKFHESPVGHHSRYPGNGFTVFVIGKSQFTKFCCCSDASDLHDSSNHAVGLFLFCYGFRRAGNRVFEFKQICRECVGPHDRGLYPGFFKFELALPLCRQYGPVSLGQLCVFLHWCQGNHRLKGQGNAPLLES